MEVRKNGTSTKALYGLAIALDRLAEKLRSNKLLVESIQAYENLLSYGKNIPEMLYKKVADRCINRMRFKGENARAITIHKALIEKFPTDVNFRNNLTITYLIIDKLVSARRNVLDTLKKWPNNGLAKTLYGFILKTSDNNIEKSVKYLKEGIESREPGVLDGRFFFHLGDALLRLGRSSEAMEVYETGVKEGFFLSKYQRSLYNVDRLTGRPWWTKEQTTYKKFFDLLEENWMNIRKEGLSLLNSKGLFKDEAENLIDVGDWKQFELFSRGRKVPKNCKQAPYTCSLVEFFTPASHCRRGQIKFSVMHPDTHVWPHCGPTNCRLRAHLGLKIPPKTFIRVAESTRTWTEGKIIIFDDSFEHEVWHNGTETRLILIVDVWHPELTANEKQTLPAI
ncbi:aspartyl/asparaginyl beta-hydroxylase-like isoform X2 [Chrysoperla carnea]|uniref:aspartyl/asparaginyl beta-hydroxylase-like isoform X2 n=1 Tax=Chrysoperla carnea TaxID=189513 RepID=UPI001D08A2EE|nr:aspartyl/asparaginyl beta-hydroxylase-like isoform X2 [Chrysoperla carnea]